MFNEKYALKLGEFQNKTGVKVLDSMNSFLLFYILLYLN